METKRSMTVGQGSMATEWYRLDLDYVTDRCFAAITDRAVLAQDFAIIRRNIALANDGRDYQGLMPAAVLTYHSI